VPALGLLNSDVGKNVAVHLLLQELQEGIELVDGTVDGGDFVLITVLVLFLVARSVAERLQLLHGFREIWDEPKLTLDLRRNVQIVHGLDQRVDFRGSFFGAAGVNWIFEDQPVGLGRPVVVVPDFQAAVLQILKHLLDQLQQLGLGELFVIRQTRHDLDGVIGGVLGLVEEFLNNFCRDLVEVA